MRNLTLLLLCSIVPFLVQAQYHDSIFYNYVESNISIEESPLYYPTLMEQYIDSAEYMTSEEYVHFYYGSKFQDFFNPVNEHYLVDSIKGLMFFTEDQECPFAHIDSLCDQILEDEVINLNIMKIKLFTSSKIGDQDSYDRVYARYKVLLKAILESEEIVDDQINYLVLNTSDINHVLSEKAWNVLGLTRIQNRDQDVNILIEEEEKWVHFNIGPVLDFISAEIAVPENPE